MSEWAVLGLLLQILAPDAKDKLESTTAGEPGSTTTSTVPRS